MWRRARASKLQNISELENQHVSVVCVSRVCLVRAFGCASMCDLFDSQGCDSNEEKVVCSECVECVFLYLCACLCGVKIVVFPS